MGPEERDEAFESVIEEEADSYSRDLSIADPLTEEKNKLMSFFQNNILSDLEKSQQYKEDLESIMPIAKTRLSEILNQETNKYNIAVQAMLIKWAYDTKIIKTELPKLQILLNSSQRSDRSLKRPIRSAPLVSKEEMKQFLIEGDKADRQLEEVRKEKIKDEQPGQDIERVIADSEPK